MSKFLYIIALLSLFFNLSCKKSYAPKPRGYFRIEFPEKKYQPFNENSPYTFEYPVYGTVESTSKSKNDPYWYTINFPNFKGDLYISYKTIDNSLAQLIEDTRTLSYKHAIKADAINEQRFENPEKEVYGLVYLVDGNAASSMQFYLTDSIKNFVRGALYFNTEVNKDSLDPVIDFFRKDVYHLIETFKWVN